MAATSQCVAPRLRDRPRCAATYYVFGFYPVTFTCQFDHGHGGLHQDPATGAEWNYDG